MSPNFKGLSAKWSMMPLEMKLIIANVALFLLLRFIGIIALIGSWDIDSIVDRLALPSQLPIIAKQPWTVVTYMFTHYDIFHILFNMLALYWFGQLFPTPRQLFGLYLIGGVSGAVFYVTAAQVFPGVGGYLLGASASIMAILVATAVMIPDFEIRLLLFGSVKLKWIATGTVILFAFGLTGNNAGGHVAHLGGMAAGAVYGLMMSKKGIDITAPLNNLLDMTVNLFEQAKASRLKTPKKKSYGKKTPRMPSNEDDRRELDIILDKIKKSGYSSLTAEERKRLFDVSSRIK